MFNVFSEYVDVIHAPPFPIKYVVFMLICIPLDLIVKTMWRSHVDTSGVDRKDVKRHCTKALQPNIASVERPELKELVAHHVDRLTMTQGIL